MACVSFSCYRRLNEGKYKVHLCTVYLYNGLPAEVIQLQSVDC